MLFTGRSNGALPSVQYLTQTVCKAESREAATVETFKAEQKGKSSRGRGPVIVVGEKLPQPFVILGEQMNSASSNCPQLCPCQLPLGGRKNRQHSKKADMGRVASPLQGHSLFLKQGMKEWKGVCSINYKFQELFAILSLLQELFWKTYIQEKINFKKLLLKYSAELE